MESISRLRGLIIRVLSPNEAYHVEQELFDELMVQKPRLLNLLDVGRRSQQEQREIESGESLCSILGIKIESKGPQAGPLLMANRSL
jgi:nuclear pore complex protein Nup205